MSVTGQEPRGVHLVGSVPLENAEQVFRATSAILGERVKRIPDGETGARTNWIGWQAGVLMQHPAFEIVPPADPKYAALPVFRLTDKSSGKVHFSDLGYATAAKESYALFARLKKEGVVPENARFQVSLPTPIATVAAFIATADQAEVEPAYEARMLEEMNEIAQAVPRDQLAIQWDVAVEFGIMEGVWKPEPGIEQDQVSLVARLVRIGQAVPEDVELGYHLCYGDAGHEHFVQPKDTARLVLVANAIAAGLKRPLNWIHMPVPRERDDDAYFAPLKGLKLHPGTELYLGLVHLTGGEEATRKRIEAAQRTVSVFGVGTECGMGRRNSETIPELLKMHAAVAGPQSGG
ncbi:MAG: hypothetical protein M3014_15090 [Chloroflexota bacterium]|nr:hypothetical protein [Chloroflexota bacterium]